MKIVYIVAKEMPFGGGIESYTEEVGSRLVKYGHDVTVYTLKGDELPGRTYLGMRIKGTPCIRTKVFEKITGTIMATLLQCKDENVDIVHFHGFGSIILAFIMRLKHRRIFLQGHGIEWKRSRWNCVIKFFLKLIEVESVRFADRVIVVSKLLKSYLWEKYHRESAYIPNGVNPPKLRKPSLINKLGLNGNDYIFFAARLVREKGAHYLIEAYKRLNTNLKLVIAGDAKYEGKYKEELQNLSSDNPNIIFTGFIKGEILEELFSNCFIFVLPSEIEGLSIALLEAMSYGNCCLVSDIPENLEAINNFGFSFRSKDSIDLTEKLKYLIDHQDEVDSVRKASAEYVLNNYSWDKVAQQVEKLYKQSLNKKINQNAG
jgi:glycosyltransferase involved in cell wall biosynthesis